MFILGWRPSQRGPSDGSREFRFPLSRRSQVHRVRKAAATAAAVVLTAGLTAACGSDDNEPSSGGGEQVLRWGSSTQPTSLDPRKSATFDPIFLTEVFDPLIRRTADGSFEAALATE